MELCRAGHIPRRGWGGFAVVAHIAIAWDMRIIARAETQRRRGRVEDGKVEFTHFLSAKVHFTPINKG